MKRRFCLLMALSLLFLAACGAEGESTATPEPTVTPAPTPVPEKVLIVYFSRAGEQDTVGEIEKGSTAIVAECIARRLYSELYEITPAEDRYPESYQALCEVALQEQQDKARPAIGGNLPDLDEYDTVFVGSPVWYGDWPMILYSFFEGANLSGKRVIPFCTHEGTGITPLRRSLALVLPQSQVEAGLAIRGENAQTRPEEVQDTVDRFLRDLGFTLAE